MSKPLTRIQVTVHKGKVKDADFVGKSDPYVVLEVDGVKVQTKTKKNTLTPEWNDVLALQVKPTSKLLHVHAFDEDPGKDDSLGSGTFDLDKLRADRDGILKNIRVPLTLKGKDEGFIEITIVADWAMVKLPPDTVFEVTVVNARRLIKGDMTSKPDPYIVIRTSPNNVGSITTSVKSNTTDPEWNETHTLRAGGESELILQVYDKDTVGKDLIGEVTVPFAELKLDEGKSEHRIPVFKSSKDAGLVKLFIREAKNNVPDSSPRTLQRHGISSLTVTVIDGFALKAKDVIGQAAPFVMVKVGSDSYKTSVGQMPNPVFGDSFTFRGLPQNPATDIDFLVMDRERDGVDNLIGKATVPLNTIDRHGVTSKLRLLLNNTEAGGLKVKFDPKMVPPQATRPAQPPPPPPPQHQPHSGQTFMPPGGSVPPRPPTPPSPPPPPRERHPKKVKQISQLEKRIEEQRRINEELRRYYAEESALMLCDLAEDKEDLRHQENMIRQQLAMREARGTPMPPQAGSSYAMLPPAQTYAMPPSYAMYSPRAPYMSPVGAPPARSYVRPDLVPTYVPPAYPSSGFPSQSSPYAGTPYPFR